MSLVEQGVFFQTFIVLAYIYMLAVGAMQGTSIVSDLDSLRIYETWLLCLKL